MQRQRQIIMVYEWNVNNILANTFVSEVLKVDFEKGPQLVLSSGPMKIPLVKSISYQISFYH